MDRLANTTRSTRIGGLLAATVFRLASVYSQAQDAALPVPSDSIMHEVSPGIYEVGKLRLNQATHTVTFPGAVNLDKGPLEYLLVTPAGNAHESLLVTSEVEPRDLHLAMLLLGAKGSGIHAPGPEDAPPTQLSKDYLERAPKLTGDPLVITVKWKTKEGVEKKTPVEDWILKTGRTQARGTRPLDLQRLDVRHGRPFSGPGGRQLCRPRHQSRGPHQQSAKGVGQ